MRGVNCDRPQVDVCIATYRRPQQLSTLLGSLIEQDTRGQFTFRIVVIDNDAQGTAEAVVRRMSAPAVDVVYDVEPQRSISLARNRGFRHATGEYIATIDDDEYADREWLSNLLDALTRYEADVAFGPTVPIFDADAPEYIKRCRAFASPNPPTGSTENFTDHTGNALVRHAVVTDPPFDPFLGLTGGEDTAFFQRLRRQNRKLVWCREARVFTRVPPERATLLWVAKRAFRNGNGCHRTRHSGPWGADVSKGMELLYASKRIATLSCSASLYLVAGMFNAEKMLLAVERVRGLAYMLGLCAYHFNFHYQAYRRG
jgi:succinoglycan biosynthesis protein ExoM